MLAKLLFTCLLLNLILLWSVECSCVDGVKTTVAIKPVEQPVVCTSPNTFVFYDDVEDVENVAKVKVDAEEFECDPGLVCVDHPDICVDSKVFEPDCEGAIAGTAKCNDCAGAKFTCISETQYALCSSKGQKLPYITRCDKLTQYCHVDGETMPPCVATYKDRDCKPELTTTPKPGSPVTEPTPSPGEKCEGGKTRIPVPSDRTCQKYLYCNPETGVKTEYACAARQVFHPQQEKCVSETSYTCTA